MQSIASELTIWSAAVREYVPFHYPDSAASAAAASAACITLFYFNNCGVKFQLPSENWFWQLIACNSKCDLARSDDDDDDDDFDDDERKKSKKTNFSSNDRSGHDDQNSY